MWREGETTSGLGRSLKEYVHWRVSMGWWPFKRQKKPLIDDPHIKGTRVWLTDLRELCELCFDNHVEGQRRIAEMQIEWKDASTEGEVEKELLEGLERRAFRLMRANAEDWLAWLDNEEFWQPGWRGDDGEPSGQSGMN